MTFYAFSCRAFQKAAWLGAYLLPWRKQELLRGPGSVGELPALIKSMGLRRVLLVTDAGLMRLGLPKPLLQGLESAGIFCAVYDRTVANPTTAVIEDARRLYVQAACEAVVAFGGGSPMDCAKMVAFLVAYPRATLNRVKGLQILRLHTPPPLFAVPTTAGTGAEITIAAVVSDAETHEKYTVLCPLFQPKAAVLDPVLTLGLPPDITVQTGMDALVHAVEAYISLGRTRKTDARALEAVKLIFANLDAAYSDGSNMEARDNMLYASYCAGIAFTRAYVGYAHGIAHAMGGLYGQPHGLACTVALPHVLAAYGPAAHARLARLYDDAGLSPGPESAAEKAEAFIHALRLLNTSMGIPATFSCIREEDVPEIAARCLKESNPLYPVPRIMRQGELEGIVGGMAKL